MAQFGLVEPATATDPLARQTFDEIQRELGFGMVPNIFRSMGSNPALLSANWQKFKSTILEGSLPRTVKEMIGVVVSESCPPCQLAFATSCSVAAPRSSCCA